MDRFTKSLFRSGGRKQSHNQSNRSARSDRKLMLDTGRDRLFHFDLDETLAALSNPDIAGSLKGNITIKATMQGIDAAKEYLERMVEDKVITLEESRRIGILLERYSKWR